MICAPRTCFNTHTHTLTRTQIDSYLFTLFFLAPRFQRVCAQRSYFLFLLPYSSRSVVCLARTYCSPCGTSESNSFQGVVTASQNLLLLIACYQCLECMTITLFDPYQVFLILSVGLFQACVIIQQFCEFGKISAFKVTTWSPA
jgi:hypothetical protein